MRAGMTGGGMRMGLMGMGCGLVAVVTVAEAGPPARSANPGNVAIFPARGQTPDQQRQDESAAYDWATQQTGWDPHQAQALLGQQEQAAMAAANAARGGAIKGGAGGAALGAAIDAITGDASKGAAIGATGVGLTGGMRSRRAIKTAGGNAAAAVGPTSSSSPSGIGTSWRRSRRRATPSADGWEPSLRSELTHPQQGDFL